jgi:hypothetical protein
MTAEWGVPRWFGNRRHVGAPVSELKEIGTARAGDDADMNAALEMSPVA